MVSSAPSWWKAEEVFMCARRFDTQDSLYDTAWSEAHENQIVVACGDGSVKLFDIALNNFPVQSWQEHNR
jgi:peroxin-7